MHILYSLIVLAVLVALIYRFNIRHAGVECFDRFTNYPGGRLMTSIDYIGIIHLEDRTISTTIDDPNRNNLYYCLYIELEFKSIGERSFYLITNNDEWAITRSIPYQGDPNGSEIAPKSLDFRLGRLDRIMIRYAIAAQDSCVRRTGGAGLIFTRTIAWLLSFTPKAHLIFDNNTEVEPFAKDIF